MDMSNSMSMSMSQSILLDPPEPLPHLMEDDYGITHSSFSRQPNIQEVSRQEGLPLIEALQRLPDLLLPLPQTQQLVHMMACNYNVATSVARVSARSVSTREGRTPKTPRK